MKDTLVEIIQKKRDGRELTAEEIEIFIKAVVSRTLSDVQIGAMLMAMFLNGLTSSETINLTKSMILSGEIFGFEEYSKDIMVDKHSTGGVGDKVSMVLAPALAAHGLLVPMMSGWSLNHTGGTLDKLLSIPGFQVSLDVNRMKACLAKAGCFICCASKTFVPADAILYKFRDMTCTVESHGLIASSILSKKAAEGIGVLVVDVKFGRGSFLRTEKDAKSLAETLVKMGQELQMTVRTVISEMNVPIGRYIGNSLEVLESVKCLRNEVHNSLFELVKFIGGVVLESKGLAKTHEQGKTIIAKSIENGTALNRFKKMLKAQGVTEKKADDLCSGRYWEVLPKARYLTALHATKSGIVTGLDSLKIGQACNYLKNVENENEIDRSVGVVLLKSIGDHIFENEPWLEVHHSTKVLSSRIEDLLKSSLVVEPNAINLKKNIIISLYS